MIIVNGSSISTGLDIAEVRGRRTHRVYPLSVGYRSAVLLKCGIISACGSRSLRASDGDLFIPRHVSPTRLHVVLELESLNLLFLGRRASLHDVNPSGPLYPSPLLYYSAVTVTHRYFTAMIFSHPGEARRTSIQFGGCLAIPPTES